MVKVRKGKGKSIKAGRLDFGTKPNQAIGKTDFRRESRNSSATQSEERLRVKSSLRAVV